MKGSNKQKVPDKKPLTDARLKKYLNKVHDKPFEESDRDSISIRVSAKGKIAWQYRYRFENKAERLTLGHYPNLSQSEVRKLIPELQGLIFSGKNPKLEWKKKRSENTENAKFTLTRLVEFWFESVAESKYKNTTYDNYRSTIDKWIKNEPKKKNSLKVTWVKKYLKIPFDDIRNSDWMDYFDWICKEGSATTAGSVFKLLKTVITWG